MSSITASTGPRSKRSYLTMADFSLDIFTYTTSYNRSTRVTTGTLTEVGGNDCPQGRFLYENGRKLYPGAHPGVNTYMVGVFDPVSFISGYIDPNSKIFTPMNTDKPVDTAAAEGQSGGVFGTDPNTETSDLAQPVYTRGDIYAEGSMDISGNTLIHGSEGVKGSLDVSGNALIHGSEGVKGSLDISGSLTAFKLIRSSNVVPYTINALNQALAITPAEGQVHLVNFATGASGSHSVTVTNTEVNNTLGAIIYIMMTNNSGSTRTIDFNGNFKTFTGGTQGQRTITNGSTATFAFIALTTVYDGGSAYYYELFEQQNAYGI